MSIEEAEIILNEAVISEPSTQSYTYISAEEINKAISKLLEERVKEQQRIKELEGTIVKERNKLENIIKEMKIENYPSKVYKEIFLNKYIDKLKKASKQLFLLEN